MSAPESIWLEIITERERAHAKHGDTSMELQPATSLDRLFILVEEVGEVADHFLRAHAGFDRPLGNRDHLVSALREVVRAGERARHLNDARHAGADALPTMPAVNTEAIRKELIQVAAMAGAWADVC